MSQVLPARQIRQDLAVRLVQPQSQFRALEPFQPRRDLRRQAEDVLAYRDELRGHVPAVGVDRDELPALLRQLQFFSVRRCPPFPRLLIFEIAGPVTRFLGGQLQASPIPAPAGHAWVGPVPSFRHPFFDVELHLALRAPEFQGDPPHVDHQILCRRSHASIRNRNDLFGPFVLPTPEVAVTRDAHPRWEDPLARPLGVWPPWPPSPTVTDCLALVCPSFMSRLRSRAW
jgi:hypothetical protein